MAISWKGVRDGIADGVASAVNDIRHKYEEVMFGRQVTDTVGSIHGNERPMEVAAPESKPAEKEPDRVDPEAFRERWAPKAREPGKDLGQDNDHDFDR